MKSKEFLDILTRVVNSRSGPRFLEVLHELRELLEKACISEEADQKLEPGKPIRQRVPEEVARRAREAKAAPEPEPPAEEPLKVAVEEGSSPAEPAPQGRWEPDEAPAKTEEAMPGKPSPEFIEAGPNRLIRKPGEPPSASGEPPSTPGEPAAKPPRKVSIRALVQKALGEGGKDMAQLKEIVRAERGQVSHLYQQIYLALRQIEAVKSESGVFTLPGERSPGNGAEKRAEGDAGRAPAEGPKEAKGPASDPASGPGGFKQLNIIEELAGSTEDPPA